MNVVRNEVHHGLTFKVQKRDSDYDDHAGREYFDDANDHDGGYDGGHDYDGGDYDEKKKWEQTVGNAGS